MPVEESSDRFRECVEIVLASWRQERMSYQGRFWKYDGVEVLPKPLQSPASALLAGRHVAGLDPARAAEKGYDILQDPHATHADIGVKRSLYYQILREHGFPVEGRVIPTARLLAVGATDRRRPTWRGPGRRGRCRRTRTRASARARPPPISSGGDPVERYMNDVVIRGTPERVIDKIAELRETIGLEYLMCAPLSHQTFTLFTERVLPKLL